MAAASENIAALAIERPFKPEEHKNPADFEIKVGGDTITGHRAVLTQISPFFRGLCNSGMHEDEDGVVVLEGFPADIVRNVISYYYGNHIVIEWDDIIDYLVLADYWRLADLIKRLQQYVVSHLQPDNFLDWYCTAKMYQLELIVGKIRTMMMAHFKEASESRVFAGLRVEDMKDLMTHDLLSKFSSDIRLNALMKWTLADESERGKYFNELLEHFQFTQCSPGYVRVVLNVYKKTLSAEEAASMSSYFETIQAQVERTSKNSEEANKAILLGGYEVEDSIVKKIIKQTMLLDLKSRDVTPYRELPEPLLRYCVLRCKTPAGIFHGGGLCTQNATNSDRLECAMFDPSSWQFTCLPKVLRMVSNVLAGTVCVNGKIYISGWIMELYCLYLDLETLTWTSVDLPEEVHKLPVLAPEMPPYYQTSLARIRYSTATYTTAAFCSLAPWIVGIHQSDQILEICNLWDKHVRDIWFCDTRTHVWKVVKVRFPSMLTFHGACIVAVGQAFYILGGHDEICIRFTPRNEEGNNEKFLKIEFLSSPGCQIYGRAIAIGESKILLCGDEGITLEYDIATDRWEKINKDLPYVTKIRRFCAVV